MYLQQPPATPEADRLYQANLDGEGFVMNLTRLWAWRPEICEGFASLRGRLMGDSSLSKKELATIVCSTVATLGDSYCAFAWGRQLAAASDERTAASVIAAADDGELSPRERALAAWARKVTRDPNSTTKHDVDSLRAAGLSDREIFEATALVAFRLAFSTVNDALGVAPDWQVAEAAPPAVRAAVTFGRAPAPRDAG